MRLTWKDLWATVTIAAVVASYAVYLNGTATWLLSSARGTAALVLLLGAIGCGFGAAADLYLAEKSRMTMTFTAIASTLGMLALAAAAGALITGSSVVLAFEVGTVVALWLLATVRHAITRPIAPAAPQSRDHHEVITRNG
jgi:hypothetical protein